MYKLNLHYIPKCCLRQSLKGYVACITSYGSEFWSFAETTVRIKRKGVGLRLGRTQLKVERNTTTTRDPVQKQVIGKYIRFNAK